MSFLNEERINEILIENRENYLNRGDFFDGSLWRNMKGKPYADHPSKLKRQESSFGELLRISKRQNLEIQS